MTLKVINGHNIKVPDDMEVIIEGQWPGAYDHIKYKGIEICTEDVDLTEIYTGVFFVNYYNEMVRVKDLNAARALIDQHTSGKSK